ncbi:MAG: NAD(P)/FAD-dependent oxidoreductase [Acidimicrobiia bacterium]|nr:NAD(P)/FAD-dependent oxidoreductase [Acidimicrobiia bacterium]
MTQATATRPAVDARGEPMPRRAHYDFVIVGGGPNGLGIAAYLSKWGFSVCMLEARPEIGGGAENAEPVPGYSIDPHASYFYGAAAPGLEQLDLPRHGFRMSYIKNFGGCISHDGRAFFGGNFFHDQAGRDPETYVRLLGVDRDTAKLYLEFMEGLRPHAVDFFRSIYWTPPYDERWAVPKGELPVARVLREAMPSFWDESLLDMSFMEMMEGLGLPDPIKAGLLVGSWGNGPHPYWKGMALPGFACTQLMMYSGAAPVGGMHALAHALARCALAHGARIWVNSPVSEVIVHDGRAVGVRVADDSLLEEKTVWADMGVILGTHIKQFPDLVGRAHLGRDLVQRIEDLSLKGGSLFVTNLIVKELPVYKDAPEEYGPDDYPAGMSLHCTTEKVLDLMRDVHSFRTHPTDPDDFAGVWFVVHDQHDPTRARAGEGHVITVNLQVPAPEDHRDGPEAVNRAKDEIVENIKTVLRQYAPNMTDDVYIATPTNTPYDSELRNMAFVGGNWEGARSSQDEWWSRKPLPEMARYRTPVEGLYLCNQTSYPGGLCLLAVPYNLMHILEEDYERMGASTPEWWYRSKWHLTDEQGGTQ